MAAKAEKRSRVARDGSLWERFRAIVDIWVDLFDRHNLLTYASAIALQTLVALIALALLGLGILGVTGEQNVWNDRLAPQFEQRLLLPVFAGADRIAQKIFETDSTGLVIFASALAVWEVSGAVRACMGALTRVYETDEDRRWWIRFPISFGIGAGIIAALIGAILLVLTKAGPSGALQIPAAIGRWLAAVILITLAFGVLVRFAPAERRAKKWATGGAALVVVAWIVESLIFKWYVSSVANFRTAEGSLAVFLVLTSYLYVGAIILLVGIELDELLRKDASDGGERGILDLVRGLF